MAALHATGFTGFATGVLNEEDSKDTNENPEAESEDEQMKMWTGTDSTSDGVSFFPFFAGFISLLRESMNGKL